MTEAEHHRLRGAKGKEEEEEEEEEDVILGHSGASLRATHNLNLAWGMSSPVDAYPPTTNGFCDVRGNVWEW